MVYNFQQGMMAGASAAGGYTIDQSIRFNDDDSAYLSRTPASAGNRKTWTWSGWVKRGNLFNSSVPQIIFSAANGSTLDFVIQFGQSDDTLRISDYSSGSASNLITTQLFRDPSAWYHFVLQYDTTQATSSDRMKLYVNGTQVTAFGTASYPTQNYDSAVNNNIAHNISRGAYSANGYFDGYQAEINFIDGTALAPTSFGKSDPITGVWIPIKYAGTYGTNGFYITGENSASLGTDYSGNGNNFTSSGLTTADQVTDTPTENYATINPLTASNTSMSFHEANLKVEMNAAYPGVVLGSIGVSTGKYYWEVTLSGTGSSANGYATGVAVADWANRNVDPIIATPYNHHIDSRAVYYDNDVYASSGVNFTAGDIIGVALNCDDGEISYYKNNTLIVTRATLEAGETWFPLFKNSTSVADLQYSPDFGQLGFTYTPPDGFKALSTANLPEPTIKDPSAYFQATAYAGSASALEVNQAGNSTFQPDFVWIKQRTDAATNHQLVDAVRGKNLRLETDNADAEGDVGSGGITSFDADGFSVGTNSNYNAASKNFIAWQWKANGTGSSNTDGSITSTVSVNTTAGFSVVTYTGTGANATVGHGLGIAPSMVICKQRNASRSWNVYHEGLTSATYVIYLNQTIAQASDATAWNSTAPASTVFSVGSANGTNSSGNGMLAYCFAEVEGFSKIGKYTGNGSSNGPFVHTGFRPAFILIGKTAVGAGWNWQLRDSSRSPYNVDSKELRANTSGAEVSPSGETLDLLSNGFKPRSANGATNQSGYTYIYYAVAETPFKYANAR